MRPPAATIMDLPSPVPTCKGHWDMAPKVTGTAGGMLPMLPDRQWFSLNAKLGSAMALPQKIKKDTQG